MSMKPSESDNRRRLGASEGGATALEFALLAPVFMVLVFAILQLSIAMHHGNSAKWAVERASRHVLVDNSLTQVQIQELIDDYLKAVGSSAGIEITYAVDTSGSIPYGTISGTYSHVIDVPLLPEFTARFPATVVVPHKASS